MSTKSLGKAIEYKVASEMLREGYVIYLPAADDHGVDMVALTPAGHLVAIQVKASFKQKQCGLFSAIRHAPRSNYYFVFYVAKLDKTWILSSGDFLAHASCVSPGNTNAGKYSINVCSSTCSNYCFSNYSSKIV